MPNRLPVQVDVYVQDHFSDRLQTENAAVGLDEPAFCSPTDGSSLPIAAETWETWFQTWLAALQFDLSPTHQYELSLRLTTDTEMQTLNAQYRHVEQPTDVLAFAALETIYPEPAELRQVAPLYLGDIVISVETAQQQAQQQQHSLEQELAWLATHGLLHLLGWDHPDELHLDEMLLQQEVLLQTVGLKTNYHGAD